MVCQLVSSLLIFYGLFLILCGITAVVFIGFKAKTALVSGGTAGIMGLVLAYFVSQNAEWARVGGVVLALGLFIVFSWRSTKTLFVLMEMISNKQEEVKKKGIAFMIISLMAVVSWWCLWFRLY
ncbi:MAG: hypothetical protein ACK4ND_12550 [Cytophagaceae bacterium]